MKRPTSMLIAAACLALAGAASAQCGTGVRGGMLGADGKLTKEEFMQRAEQRFAQMDANKDGVIDQSEHQQMRQRMRECRQRQGGMRMKGGPAANGGAAQTGSQPAAGAPAP
ncbi:hypothetical protein [Immundisolibacter sp.]|uniref:hypothetical protein n=1 Tax=Immundisolibacter sp. TaxID=1934948 RepID=UPI00260F32C1|nr:hypothetical protein [Immundisolibacter sp.]MDD3650097.1 hypothetical protein [Immundisolibacter sp.]